MFALILILLISPVTILTALLESFYTPEDLAQMGVTLHNTATSEPPGLARAGSRLGDREPLTVLNTAHLPAPSRNTA